MFYLRGVQHNFVIEYLDEIETKFKNTLGCLSGFQMGSNHEKNWRLKISWHTPFNLENIVDTNHYTISIC